MNNYKKVEQLLYNYKMLKISIENIEEEIEYLENDYGVSGINYEETGTSKTNKINSIVEDTALSISEKKYYLQHQIEGIKRKIESVDRAMKGLVDIERAIITEKYIEGKQWYVVAYNNGCSESTAKRYRRSAINKLVVGIYGKEGN